MKILIIDSYYPNALKKLREQFGIHIPLTYAKQLELLLKQHFGTGDAYSYYLNSLGHKSWDIISNDELLQRQWASEHKIKVKKFTLLSALQTLPYLYRYVGKPRWMQEILLAQITDYKPDILYFQDLTVLNPQYLKNLHRKFKLVGQIASMPPPHKYLKHFDLLLSSLPNLVE